MLIAKTLSFYKRQDVRRAIVEAARDKEVAVKFTDRFGKRPEVLQGEGDVLDFAAQRATSFHASEELWDNPLLIKTGMSNKEIAELRKGWDLILDVDCPYWPLAKVITHLFIKALEEHGIGCVTTKFSVTGDTPVLCRTKGQVHLIPIKEAIALFKAGWPVSVLSLRGYSVGFNKVIDSLEHRKELYEIYYKNTTLPIRTSPDHSVYVFREDRLLSIPAGEITESDFLVGFKKVALKQSVRSIPVHYVLRNKKYSEEIPITKDIMRLFGYYVSEGHLVDKTYHYNGKRRLSQIGFSFHIKERAYIDDVNKLITSLDATKSYNYPRKERPRNVEKPHVNTTQVLFHSVKWCAFFRDNFGKGAKNKKIPSWFFTLPKEFFLEFLQAYINGDGHTSKYSHTTKTVSKELATTLVWLCKIHGINCSLTKEKSHAHMMPHGKICVTSISYHVTIPLSELDSKTKLKFSPESGKELIPAKGLLEVYHQCQPKLFVKNRVLQTMVKKESTSRRYVKRIIDWFNTTKAVEYTPRSKRILRHYERLLDADLMFHKVRRVKKTKRTSLVYDVTVEDAENFFGGHQPILLHNSGNKGFHIAVPFEAFPKEFNTQATKDLFPEAPRRIAYYLLDYLSTHYVEEQDQHLVFDKRYKIRKKTLAEKLGKDSFTKTSYYDSEGVELTEEEAQRYLHKKTYLLCGICGHVSASGGQNAEALQLCPRCNSIMQEEATAGKSVRVRKQFDPLAIIEVDTILIAHRHLYRMPYSFHEKSGRVSVPVRTQDVLSFKKEDAEAAKADLSIPFLDRAAAKEGEATKLLIAAYDFDPHVEEEGFTGEKRTFEIPAEAIPEEYFPPCIQTMLKGLKDGRKRAMFTLINFLRGCGWEHDKIEETLHAWNERNDERLREVEIKGRLRYEKTKKEHLPPHNCKRYYQDFGVCKPDALCSTIKNPLQYAKRKAAMAGVGVEGKGKRAKLTEEQKAARRAYKARKKGAAPTIVDGSEGS